MDNFYTVTVYEKGAEIIRVYHTLLGKEGFRYCDLEKKEKQKTYTFGVNVMRRQVISWAVHGVLWFKLYAVLYALVL